MKKIIIITIMALLNITAFCQNNNQAQHYISQAEKAYENLNYKAALEYYEKASKLDASDANVWYNMAFICEKKLPQNESNLKSAIKYYKNYAILSTEDETDIEKKIADLQIVLNNLVVNETKEEPVIKQEEPQTAQPKSEITQQKEKHKNDADYITKPQTIEDNPPLYYYKGCYYLQENNRAMKKAEYARFLLQNCTSALKIYDKGDKMFKIAIGLSAAGGAFLVAGCVLMPLCGQYVVTYYYSRWRYEYVNYPGYIIGISFVALGATALVASVPLYVFGNIYQTKKSVDHYNKYITKKVAFNYQIGVVPSGIGVRLQF